MPLIRSVASVCVTLNLIILVYSQVYQYDNYEHRIQQSCMITSSNFNRSCILDKIVFLVGKLPIVSRWKMPKVGSVQLIKLPQYATNEISAIQPVTISRSLTTNIVFLIYETLEYFLDSYGIKIPLPPLTKKYPGIVVEEISNSTISVDKDEGRGKKKDQKRFAIIFPLIATFKFVLIKALLIPILMGIIVIKKMLILAAMAIPAVIAMLRICRFGPGGILGNGLTAAAAAPLMAAAPYVASDTIIGEFSNYAPAAMTAQQQPYYNKQQEFGGKSFPSLNPYNSLTNY